MNRIIEQVKSVNVFLSCKDCQNPSNCRNKESSRMDPNPIQRANLSQPEDKLAAVSGSVQLTPENNSRFSNEKEIKDRDLNHQGINQDSVPQESDSKNLKDDCQPNQLLRKEIGIAELLLSSTIAKEIAQLAKTKYEKIELDKRLKKFKDEGEERVKVYRLSGRDQQLRSIPRQSNN